MASTPCVCADGSSTPTLVQTSLNEVLPPPFQSGHWYPQTLALDRATINMSDEIYVRLAAAGITNMAVPAGKPFLKPWIERFFATMGKKFLQQFNRLIHASARRWGRLIELIIHALANVCVEHPDRKELLITDFAKVFQRWTGVSDAANVFIVENPYRIATGILYEE